MKTIKRLLAGATCTACLTALLLAPTANAQLSSFDASLAHFDGQAVGTTSASLDLEAPGAEPAALDPMVEAYGEAEFEAAVRNLRDNAPSMSATDWKAYGEQLHDALSLDHEGLQHSALRLIIAYSDNLDLGNDAVVDLMRLYREDDSEQVRRMAVVALGQLDSPLAVDWLERAQSFEKTDTVKRTIAAVVSANRTS